MNEHHRPFKSLLILSTAALFFFFGLSQNFTLAEEKTYPNAHLLVETGWVADHLNDPGVRLVDVRPAAEYAQGHIKNAVNIDVRAALTVTANGVKGMVAPREQVEEVFSRAGIGKETHVVAYDASGGLWAARLFWILDYYGHAKVSLVNGGMVKWRAEGRDVTAEPPSPKEAKFTVLPDPSKLATMDWIKERLGKGGPVILDARSQKEFVGEDLRSARGGHIPGASNLDWVKTVTGEQKTFLPYMELRNLVHLTSAKKQGDVLTYCQTGVRAAQLYFVLKLLGYEKVRLYDGSWEEWGNAQSTPVEQKAELEHKTC